MIGVLLLYATAAVSAVETGWVPSEDGEGVEYLIQIPPDGIDLLKSGEAGLTDVPEEVRGIIRSYKVTIGTKKLPRVLPTRLKTGLAGPGKVPPIKSADPLGAPGPLPDTKGKPIEANHAMHTESAGESSKSQAPNAKADVAAEPDRPWLPLSLVSMVLAASLGGNAYLAWVAGGLRSRYRTLLDNGGGEAIAQNV